MASKGPFRVSQNPVYASFYKALAAMGATAWCTPCYSHVMPGHGCPDWSALGLPVYDAPAAVLTLEGGLADEAEEYETVGA